MTCWRGDVCVCALLCPWETGEQDLKEEDEDWKSCVAKVFNWKSLLLSLTCTCIGEDGK